LEKAIENHKKTVGGRDLTDEELKLVSDTTLAKYGVTSINVFSDFLDERERVLYEAVKTKSLEELSDIMANGKNTKSSGKKVQNLFAMLTKLREVATDARILERAPSVKALLMMDEMLASEFKLPKKRKKKRNTSDEDEDDIDEVDFNDDEWENKIEDSLDEE